ncbi:hypothetical protein M885DRAFT_530517 [Pelagophyceae sp. CCMP2097]|nr:hypothetical protein M885DRAFT_530517 [Pelagophyceae sp. CCMP2097]
MSVDEVGLKGRRSDGAAQERPLDAQGALPMGLLMASIVLAGHPLGLASFFAGGVLISGRVDLAKPRHQFFTSGALLVAMLAYRQDEGRTARALAALRHGLFTDVRLQAASAVPAVVGLLGATGRRAVLRALVAALRCAAAAVYALVTAPAAAARALAAAPAVAADVYSGAVAWRRRRLKHLGAQEHVRLANAERRRDAEQRDDGRRRKMVPSLHGRVSAAKTSGKSGAARRGAAPRLTQRPEDQRPGDQGPDAGAASNRASLADVAKGVVTVVPTTNADDLGARGSTESWVTLEKGGRRRLESLIEEPPAPDASTASTTAVEDSTAQATVASTAPAAATSAPAMATAPVATAASAAAAAAPPALPGPTLEAASDASSTTAKALEGSSALNPRAPTFEPPARPRGGSIDSDGHSEASAVAVDDLDDLSSSSEHPWRCSRTSATAALKKLAVAAPRASGAAQPAGSDDDLFPSGTATIETAPCVDCDDADSVRSASDDDSMDRCRHTRPPFLAPTPNNTPVAPGNASAAAKAAATRPAALSSAEQLRLRSLSSLGICGARRPSDVSDDTSKGDESPKAPAKALFAARAALEPATSRSINLQREPGALPRMIGFYRSPRWAATDSLGANVSSAKKAPLPKSEAAKERGPFEDELDRSSSGRKWRDAEGRGSARQRGLTRLAVATIVLSAVVEASQLFRTRGAHARRVAAALRLTQLARHCAKSLRALQKEQSLWHDFVATRLPEAALALGRERERADMQLDDLRIAAGVVCAGEKPGEKPGRFAASLRMLQGAPAAEAPTGARGRSVCDEYSNFEVEVARVRASREASAAVPRPATGPDAYAAAADAIVRTSRAASSSLTAALTGGALIASSFSLATLCAMADLAGAEELLFKRGRALRHAGITAGDGDARRALSAALCQNSAQQVAQRRTFDAFAPDWAVVVYDDITTTKCVVDQGDDAGGESGVRISDRPSSDAYAPECSMGSPDAAEVSKKRRWDPTCHVDSIIDLQLKCLDAVENDATSERAASFWRSLKMLVPNFITTCLAVAIAAISLKELVRSQRRRRRKSGLSQQRPSPTLGPHRVPLDRHLPALGLFQE